MQGTIAIVSERHSHGLIAAANHHSIGTQYYCSVPLGKAD